jgi:hypothetical protein
MPEKLSPTFLTPRRLRRVSARDEVTGIIAGTVLDFVKRVCECERIKEIHAKDLELARVADEVMAAISEGHGGVFGPVVVKVQKKFLGRREIKALLFGREVNVDTLLSEVSKAKSRAAWIANDCSDRALIESLYKGEDRYLIEVVQRNFEKFKYVCLGRNPEIDFGNVPAYVVDGIKKGILLYLSHGVSS